jgi:hypothetical protein
LRARFANPIGTDIMVVALAAHTFRKHDAWCAIAAGIGVLGKRQTRLPAASVGANVRLQRLRTNVELADSVELISDAL